MTKGGVIGVITDIDENIITLEVARDINIKVSRDAIASAIGKDGVAVSANKGGKQAKKGGG